MPVFLGGVILKSSHLLWMCLGLDWLESFSGLSCMYSASCLEARELGVARIRAVPKIFLLLHRLKLMSCVCTRCHCHVLALLAVASRQALSCRDTLHPTLGMPRPSLLQTVGEQSWPGSGTHFSSARTSPPPQGRKVNIWQLRLGNVPCVVLKDL